MYVLDQQRQIELIKQMTQLRRDEKSLEVYYHHPSTNAMWKSYFPKATPRKRGPKVLRTEPLPEQLSQRLENCLTERNPENAAGLAIELSINPDKWESIMDIIEQNYRQYDRRQLSSFLKRLEIEEYEKLFSEINYNMERDDKFKELASRSKKIRFKRFWFF